jgi:hemerythrin-like domain-containing protein
MREHRVIERMLAVLSRELEAMHEQGRVDPGLIDVATDFIRTYADRCHHGKEEEILFRRLGERDLDTQLATVMVGLIEDHMHGRVLTKQLVDANRRYARGEGEALAEIESALQGLIEFYPVHIEKEDRHFFKPCLEYFTDAEQAQMLRDFDDFDRFLIHEKYRSVVEDLERASMAAPGKSANT